MAVKKGFSFAYRLCERPMNARRYAIPNRLNAILVVIVSAALGLILWRLSIATRTWEIALALVAFAAVFQTNFALFHEAGHQKLHTHSRWNALLGAICGVWFGMSYSMFAVTHTSHHLRNRTDAESFDFYTAAESRVRKAVGWYGMLIGVWYWIIPIANLLLLTAPRVYRRLAERLQITVDVIRQPEDAIARIRFELLLVLAAPAAMLLLGVPPLRLLMAYLAASFLWSTTQYLEHAYAPRSVIDGAFNLDAPFLYRWINLHRELDLNHHRHPHESWLYLPRFSEAGEVRRSYVRHYFAQWRGPRATDEAAPLPLASEDLA